MVELAAKVLEIPRPAAEAAAVRIKVRRVVMVMGARWIVVSQ
jgi:hypothetical protein